ncbi:NAD(P)/FAD-dependent oxidoreductase [Fertoebacter nigrum]|uniref:Pyridine nucleotide-disulfide oxidoreductase domain-containing protein 2 n=1 Tax=Fertoeibacter niger TaxID=2656921 RepID=A0A8X8H307_9RHOB|nr:NAD(P)/FAD-dependent oxidoreductase [Fertoeibacter niger]NUB46240.1 NAD(P)/FAD-dependent oxidoreductase [Fertoeibacter niger]
MPSCDAIIIGGGTNGLACAARLAASGRRVTVLEAAPAMGGGASTVEFAPGYRVSGLAHLVLNLDPRVVQGMDLARHGLGYATTNLATTALSATGDHLRLDGPFGAHAPGLSEADRAAWAALRSRLLAFARVLAPFNAMAPPRIARRAGNDTLRLAKLGLGVRALGKEEFREFLRMILINVADVLEDDLTDDRLRGALAFDATLGAWLGPRSPNSLILLLNRLAGAQGALAVPQGGMGAVAGAMTRAATAAGVALRCGAKVARVLVTGDAASGVMLDTGEELHAPLVISAINPRVTFQRLVGPQHLDAGFFTRTGHIRSRGGAAKLHLALKGLPDFRGADPTTRLVIAPSVGVVENAFNAVKYAEVPDAPVMEVILPSAHGTGMAPDGCHSLSAIVQFAPHAPENPDAARAQMLEAALRQLEAHAPGLRGLILHAELLMPYDIAAKFGMEGGNWHHGELAVEQMLFLRPLPEAAQYATPLPGLWLAGAGSHPGGGISGAAGWNAADRIIKVLK